MPTWIYSHVWIQPVPPATCRHLRAPLIIGVNKHNNLITLHNGEDEHVSITQRGGLQWTMGSIAGGVETSWLWPWHIHPHQITADKHAAVAIQKEAFSVFWLFFLTIERPVLVMVCLYWHWEKNGGLIAFINQAGVKKRLHTVLIVPSECNLTERSFDLKTSLSSKHHRAENKCTILQRILNYVNSSTSIFSKMHGLKTATSHSLTFLDVLTLHFLLNQVIWQVSGGYCGESLTQVIKHKPFF